MIGIRKKTFSNVIVEKRASEMGLSVHDRSLVIFKNTILNVSFYNNLFEFSTSKRTFNHVPTRCCDKLGEQSVISWW
jgi:hypothetical protein